MIQAENKARFNVTNPVAEIRILTDRELRRVAFASIDQADPCLQIDMCQQKFQLHFFGFRSYKH